MVVDEPRLALVLTVVAVGCGALVALRYLTIGALLAGGASFSASYLIREHGGIDASELFGSGVGLLLAEALGLGGLAAWCTRRLPAERLVPALAGLTAAIAVLGEWRIAIGGYRFVSIALLIGFGGCVAAGALLRQSDRERATAADRARQDERLAIARELHDVVAHHVTGIVVQAQAGQLIAPTDPARAAGTLAGIERAGAEALASMRKVVGALRDADTANDVHAPTAPAATIAELQQLATRTSELGLPVRLHVDVQAVPAGVALSVHRIVREALTNARRHATGATGVDVEVRQGPAAITVAVVDDGDARGGTSSGGFGVVGMAERVHASGGRFRAGPRAAPARGWEVRASFPLPAPFPLDEMERR
jgi:signal transduction histidine kinase